jgi:hypothetical protein
MLARLWLSGFVPFYPDNLSLDTLFYSIHWRLGQMTKSTDGRQVLARAEISIGASWWLLLIAHMGSNSLSTAAIVFDYATVLFDITRFLDHSGTLFALDLNIGWIQYVLSLNSRELWSDSDIRDRQLGVLRWAVYRWFCISGGVPVISAAYAAASIRGQNSHVDWQ